MHDGEGIGRRASPRPMTTRLSLALDKGLLELPSGAVGFWNAPGTFHPPVENAYLSQSFAPWLEALKAQGLRVSPEPDAPVAASVIFCHRAKPATLDLIAKAIQLTEPGGLIALEGDKTDGVDSVIKLVKPLAPEVETFAKSHGKLAWFANPGTAPSEWQSDWITLASGFQTWPGIFSADGIDKGSALLTETLPPLKGTVADLGAGWGYLSKMLLDKSPDISAMTLIEADYHAIEAAKRNISDPRASFIWGDANTHTGAYDAVITNPPFHTSRKPDPEVGRAFLRSAARLLKPKGALWCVANRTLPYETLLDDLFRNSETSANSPGFKVLCAKYPRDTKPTRPALQGRVT